MINSGKRYFISTITVVKRMYNTTKSENVIFLTFSFFLQWSFHISLFFKKIKYSKNKLKFYNCTSTGVHRKYTIEYKKILLKKRVVCKL